MDAANPLSKVLWRKIRETFRIDFLLEKKPKSQMVLYEIDIDDLNIDLDLATQWSPETALIYNEIRINGYTDYVCSKPVLSAFFNEINLEKQEIDSIDPEIHKFKNLQIVRLGYNKIRTLENIPQNVKEVYLYHNSLERINSRLCSENLLLLGLGFNMLQDDALDIICKGFPKLISLDLSFNLISSAEEALGSLVRLQFLKILNLMGNPLCLIQNYRAIVLNELKMLKFLDKSPTVKEEKIDNKPKRLTPLQLAQQEAQQAAAQAAAANQKQPAQSNKQTNQKPGAPQLKPQQTVKETPAAQQHIAQEQDDFSDMLKNPKEGMIFVDTRATVSFKLSIQTLENVEGVLLDSLLYPEMASKPAEFQTCYWISFEFAGAKVITKDKPVLFDTATTENEKSRVSFDFNFSEGLPLNRYVRDCFIRGIQVRVHKREPVLQADDEAKKAKINPETNCPETTEKVLGVCQISLQEWLSDFSRKRAKEKKYSLFPEALLEELHFHSPKEDEAGLVKKFYKEEEKPLEVPIIDPKKDPKAAAAQKKPEVKKQPDAGKKLPPGQKAKEIVEKPIVPLLDWPVDERAKVFIDEKRIVSSLGAMLLAVKVEIE